MLFIILIALLTVLTQLYYDQLSWIGALCWAGFWVSILLPGLISALLNKKE
jgi:hypothetical protein